MEADVENLKHNKNSNRKPNKSLGIQNQGTVSSVTVEQPTTPPPGTERNQRGTRKFAESLFQVIVADFGDVCRKFVESLLRH